MHKDITLDADADDQELLARVVNYYHDTLGRTPDPVAYLHKRGVTNAQAVGQFRIGYSDRSLGVKLPSKQNKAGAALRTRLLRLGLFRESGHEHFRGSITFPIHAGDGTGRIVDVYGRKTRAEHLRKGTPVHTHLDDELPGVWNVGAFGATEEIILCGSLWDALTFWGHGYRNATCAFEPGVLSRDVLAAFAEFRIRRVLTTCEKFSGELLAAGLEVFVVKLPQGIDANAYALKAGDPADALGALLRCAEWVGRPSAKAPVPTLPRVVGESAGAELLDGDDDGLEDDDDGDDVLADLLDDEQDEVEVDDPASTAPRPVVRTASPMPPVPAEVEAEVREDEVVVTFGNRRYRVRGLGKNTSLDILRVNVLVGNDTGLFVDTFDLYSARHRKAYQQQAALELCVEEATVKKDLGKLLLKLEELQDGRLEEILTPKEARPDMPSEEREAALALLRDPALMERIAADFAVVGEHTGKLVGYLAAVSRKLDNPLAVVIQSTSAAGKSTLMDAVLSFVPPEDVVKFSAMTGQSLYYMGEGSLKNKILAIAEEAGAAKASYALKLLQSEGELRIASTCKEVASGRLVTHEYRVEGPVMLFLTTTNAQVDEELLNRCLVLAVDEDREQTRAIHKLQRSGQTIHGFLAAKAREETRKLHRNAQRLLRPLLVANPYAEQLTFIDDKSRTRRDHVKYLTLIRTITLLHQHQRPVRTIEHCGEAVEYVEVTLDDIEAANALAAEVLGRSLDELPPQTRRLLDLIGGMVRAACERDGVDRADFRFSRRDVREHTDWGDTQLKLHIKRLADMEFLVVHRDKQAGRHLYELLYDTTSQGGKVLTGLIDVALLRRERSGPEGHRSGGGRGAVGPRSGGGRGGEIDATHDGINSNGEVDAATANS